MLESKLILIEGIPGSGKSTTAGKIKEYFDKMDIRSKLYLESDCNNPSDFAWTAVLDKDAYNQLIEKYGEFEQTIKEYSEKFDDGILLYFSAMRYGAGIQFPEEMMSFLSKYEPYDGKASAEKFCRLCLTRYESYAEKALQAEVLNIFESSYLQNQVNELLLFHDMEVSQIVEHVTKLAQCYEKLNPVLVYLSQSDVEETISRVAKQRLSPDKNQYPDWIENIANYISNSVYGKNHGLSGFEGTIEYFRTRKEVEMKVVKSLGIRTIIVENDSYDEEKGIAQVIEKLSNL